MLQCSIIIQSRTWLDRIKFTISTELIYYIIYVLYRARDMDYLLSLWNWLMDQCCAETLVKIIKKTGIIIMMIINNK